MSETTTAHHQDPSAEYGDLLRELTAPQRDAVVEAIRHSASSGWPATRETVSSLVAYALGRITSKEYAAQVLVALGYVDARLAPPTPIPAESTSRFDAGAGFDFLYER